MVEKKIVLEGVDPRDFFGVNNQNISYIRDISPMVKITSRGATLKVAGSKSDILDFEEKINDLISYYNRYNNISKEVIDQIFNTINPERVITIKGAKGDNNQGVADGSLEGSDSEVLVYGNGGNIIRAKSPNQKRMVEQFKSNDLMFAVGPAGSGKTYTAIALAVRALKGKVVRKIILTRPAVEAGEKLGFLPGDMKEKLDPYLQPLYDALHDMIPQAKLGEYMDEGVIQIVPIAFMRGRTLDNAFVILDEAQNATFSQLKMFLTRMGASAKFIVTGDMTQVDLPRRGDSGLPRVINMLNDIDGISVVELDNSDIVRHKLVKAMVKAFGEEN